MTYLTASAHDSQNIVDRFRQLITCQTVSQTIAEPATRREFTRFKALIRDLFPHLHHRCSRQVIGQTGILFHWRGSTDQPATVLMAHYDVVPTTAQNWQHPPFAAVIDDGYIYGRGTLDTKASCFAICQTINQLIKDNYQPKGDIYIALAGDEETAGMDAAAIAAAITSHTGKLKMVVDEGGVVSDDLLPGLTRPLALVGTAEKGYIDFNVTLRAHSGHSSVPPKQSIAKRMARIIIQLESLPFRFQMTPPVRQLLHSAATSSSGLYRQLYRQVNAAERLLPAVKHRLPDELRAVMQTTLICTMLNGGTAHNVLPSELTASFNARLLGRDTVTKTMAMITSALSDSAADIQIVEAHDATPYARTDNDAWRLMTATIQKVWPRAQATPALIMGATDARHYTANCDSVYRFSPMQLNRDELARIHSHDERIATEQLFNMLKFYQRLITQL